VAQLEPATAEELWWLEPPQLFSECLNMVRAALRGNLTGQRPTML
jgi:hypothetical protein